MSDITTPSSSSPLQMEKLFFYHTPFRKEKFENSSSSSSSAEGTICDACGNEFTALNIEPNPKSADVDLSPACYTARKIHGNISAHRGCLEFAVQFGLRFSESDSREIEILDKTNNPESRFGCLGLHYIQRIIGVIDDPLGKALCYFLNTSPGAAKDYNKRADIHKMNVKIIRLRITTLTGLFNIVRNSPNPFLVKEFKTHSLSLINSLKAPLEAILEESQDKVNLKLTKERGSFFIAVTSTLNNLETTTYFPYYPIMQGEKLTVNLSEDSNSNSPIRVIEVFAKKFPGFIPGNTSLPNFITENTYIFVKVHLKDSTSRIATITQKKLTEL